MAKCYHRLTLEDKYMNIHSILYFFYFCFINKTVLQL